LSRRALLACAAGLGLAACATGVALRPSEAQLASLRAAVPNADVAQIEPGRQLFTSRCAMCHAAPSPLSRPPEAWPSEVARMASRAHLDASQADQVSLYLQAVSQPEPGPTPRSTP